MTTSAVDAGDLKKQLDPCVQARNCGLYCVQRFFLRVVTRSYPQKQRLDAISRDR